MATAAWARSLNDPTLEFGRQRAEENVRKLRSELASEQEMLDVLTAETERRADQ